MTKKQILANKTISVFLTFVMLFAEVMTVIPERFTVDAATPAYVTWRQTDSRWGSILLGSEADSTVYNIGCAATSTCVLLAHSGVCSQDESVFNPKIGITALKKAGAFNSGGYISWGVVSKVYPNFKFIKKAALSGTQTEKLTQIQKYYNQGYYMIVSCNTKGGTSTNHWVAVRNCQNNKCTITDTGFGRTDLSKYTITNSVILYTAPNNPTPPISYTSIKAGDYYLKNKSTGTYLTVDGAKAENKQNISVAAKQTSNAFKFKISGGTSNYLSSMINTSFVVNPLSDNPSNGTNVTLYTKDNSGTQIWKFEAVSGGYIIHSGHDESCVLDVNSSNVLIKTKTGAANQVWILESADKQLSGISIATPATKTQYWRNETLQTGGLVLKANYSDGSSKNITSGFTTKYDFSQAGTCVVTISYTENGVTKSTSYNVTVTHPFSGEGTSGNPYIIANKNNLFRLASLINDNKYSNYNTLYYKQTTNIDLNDNEWTPIGIFYESSTSSTLDNNRTFNGNYDGDYHSIIGLKVDYNRNYAGLFGRTNSSAIIENLSVSGSVNGNGACTGGIIGELGYGSKVKNCDFSGTVSGVQCVGGIAGKLHRGGTISTCYVNGVITATGDGASAGGITSTIQIADHANSVNALIENCYFAGKVNASINGALSSDIIIGTVNKSTASFYGNYYLENSANGAVGENEQSGCQKFSSEKLKKAAEYLGYPYVSTGANQNDGYPVFEWQRKFISGDINSDGTVDINDAVLLQKYLLSAESFSAQQFEAADVNNDGSVDVFDMVSMRIILIQ